MIYPPLHLRESRVALATCDGWEARGHADGDERVAHFARHGMLHVQWWHDGKGLSLLTPSALTGGHYELCSPRGRYVCRTEEALRAALPAHFGVELPTALQLRAVARWHVERLARRHASPAAASRPEARERAR